MANTHKKNISNDTVAAHVQIEREREGKSRGVGGSVKITNIFSPSYIKFHQRTHVIFAIFLASSTLFKLVSDDWHIFCFYFDRVESVGEGGKLTPIAIESNAI